MVYPYQMAIVWGLLHCAVQGQVAAAPPSAAVGAAASSTATIRPSDKLPLSGLAPAKLFPGLCVVHYRISTASELCQAYFDQGLGYLYSYVWMEAARSFETAVKHDPECALAWWGLARALEKYGKMDPSTKA